jgi:dihydrofolate synthase/folylpolyglutamate synthase
MDYERLIAFLKERDMTMSRYERTEWDRFCAGTGLKLEVPFIHLTGSNGKGSTAHFLYEIYREAGYKVALFAKPYAHAPNELVEIDGKTISDSDFARIFSIQEKAILANDLSAFEIETYIAFSYINERKPDLAIIECGMGGETDSTNIEGQKPELSIITTVSLEHTAFLGRTVSEIAYNKGGIVKDERPLLVGKLPDSAVDTLRDICKRHGSQYLTVDDCHHDHYVAPYFHFDYRPYADLEILSAANYQLYNASLAIEATKILSERFPLSEVAIRKGLIAAPLECRLERRHNVILDGAHNPEAVEALVRCLESVALGKPIHVLFASFRDKNIAVELPLLARDAAEIILTTFDSPRARDEGDYFLYMGDYSYNNDYKAALADLVSKFPDDVIVVTGSLAFAFEAREYVVKDLKL